MRVFHGSSQEVRTPEIIKGRFTKDFGDGFYCTKLKRQAKRWAERKDTPTVNIYEYAPAPDLSVLDFKGMTDEWLDFIVNCRKGVPHNWNSSGLWQNSNTRPTRYALLQKHHSSAYSLLNLKELSRNDRTRTQKPQ